MHTTSLSLGFGIGLGRNKRRGAPAASPITIAQDQNRTSGVAPLAVFFDASGTTCTGVDNPFHELAYLWGFGDAGSYMPSATGPLAAHVFAAPGTYTVTLTVIATSPSLALKMATWTITVDDPDVVFAGTNTVCFSTDGDFTDAPAGCVQVTTSSVATAMGYVADGIRLRFHRGQTFTATGTEFTVTNGPVLIDAFGAGTSPDERGICANDPVFSVTTNANEEGFPWRGTDLRVCSITMVEGHTDAQTYAGFNTWHRCVDTLLFRCKTTGFRAAMGYSQDIIQAYSLQPHSGVFIAQCEFVDCRTTTTYTSGYRHAILGCHYDTNLSSHHMRVTFAQQCVIDGNVLEYPGSTRHAIKVHAAQDRANYNDFTEQVIIRDNTVRCNDNAWPITCGPEDAIHDEWVRRVLIERNRVIDEGNTQVGYYVNSADTHIRNCTLVAQGLAPKNLIFAFLGQRGVEPMPTGLACYCNTMFTDSSGSGKASYFVETDTYTGDPIPVYGNALYSQTGGSASIVIPGYESTVDAHDNIVNTGLLFEDESSQDFRPAAGSSALDAGDTTYAYDDALGIVRTHDDVGAYERA